MSVLTDEDIVGLYEEAGVPESDHDRSPYPEPVAEYPPEPGAIPLYPLALAQAAPTPNGTATAMPPGVGWARKKYGGVPVWAWGLIAIGVGGSGYLYYRTRQVQRNSSDDGDSDDAPRPSITAALTSGGGGTAGWSPSRSAFASKLERYFSRKGLGDKVRVWVDADEAKSAGNMKFISPLVNVETKGAKVPIADLQKFARREGLNPIQHEDGNIGFYPTETKRGKGWEEYIDALRDDGQHV